MERPYEGREQTAAKHFVLKRYLQALAFKILLGNPTQEISYVDAFSGPWEARDTDFADTSFMIAIGVLQEIHFQIRENRPSLKTKCLFIEKKKSSYDRLSAAVQKFHQPDLGFHVQTHHGSFEQSCNVILPTIRNTFALIFIDPTGWTGYSYEIIRPVLRHSPSEVLVNFMYDHINRAVAMSDPKTTASFDSILGGPGWKDRLDPDLAVGDAVESLFRAELKEAGAFKYVVSTRIRKTFADRPHFSIAYGTRSHHGLRAFRDVEHAAQKDHAEKRLEAQAKKKTEQTGQSLLFDATLIGSNQFKDEHDKHVTQARHFVLDYLKKSKRPVPFGVLWPEVIREFPLRDTHVKSICTDLASAGKIVASWRLPPSKRRVPNDRDPIQLTI